ncbi:hypothetical protein [Gloeocapsopsis dulcis]|uniref:Uncharacterized protein n=1 Tax=Gloeocapsopsis dulcis AAB1 = 1H9 TaxID=1433147 RepID=A0A6N8FXD9_9CHRO|nr:hypothetical protein [Gloeocapsopsis dulcis]MUL37292.1 hypothetical protein [Gloeocapsopsis dulcis AAB1 = 1H9]WNN91096.1 hypothetical protein P0S91_08475 [Gloeocapsopsis dulcis]
MSINETRFTQFGCGLCAPLDWLNFDASPMMRLQKLPLIGIIPSGTFGRYRPNVEYEELRLALQNCYRYLKTGRIFRLVLPDLEVMAKAYLSSQNSEAAHEFMRVTYLGKESRDRRLVAFLREWTLELGIQCQK